MLVSTPTVRPPIYSIGAGATIGRSAENTLVLGASVISQTHARIFFDATLGWWVAASAEAVDAVLGSSACRVRPADEPVPKAVAATPTGAFFGRLVRQIDGPDHSTRKTKVMADEFIAANGHDITDAFIDNLKPLLGADMGVTYRLEAERVAKIIKK